MSVLLDSIKSRGHWRAVIRPTEFDTNRVPYAELEPILLDRQVQLRGWFVPHISHKAHIEYAEGWVGQETEFTHHVESWRFYTTGQFSIVRGFGHDWRQPDVYTGTAEFIGINSRRIAVWSVLYFFTEILELASRLALSAAGGDEMYLRIVTADLLGRQLVVEDPGRSEFHSVYMSGANEVKFAEVFPREQLVTDHRAIAVRAAREVFLRFGWTTVQEEFLSDYQAAFVPG